MANIEHQYLSEMARILKDGQIKRDRTNTGTQSLFVIQLRHDMREGFPLLTTKTVFIRGIIHELLWMLSGDTNIHYLLKNNVHIWDEWANEEGDLGPVYGEQWRMFGNESNKVDQIAEALRLLREDPDSRRIVVSSWNPLLLPHTHIEPKRNPEKGRMALAPCHAMFQFYSRELSREERLAWAKKNRGFENPNTEHTDFLLDQLNVPLRGLSLCLFQRSGDFLIGVPFNIAAYSLLLMMFGILTNMMPLEFVHTIADAHIYSNHVDQCREQLSREPRPLPTMMICPDVESIDDFRIEDFALFDYSPHPVIKAPVSI